MVRKKRRLGTEEKDGEDRFSSLPDDIIGNILPRLPIEEAVATAVLAQRWRLAWTHMSCLNLDDDITKFYTPSFLYSRLLSKLDTTLVSFSFLRDISGEFSAVAKNLVDIEPWLCRLCNYNFLDIQLKALPSTTSTTNSTMTNLSSFALDLLNGRLSYLISLTLDHVKPAFHPFIRFPKLTYLRLDWDSYDSKEVLHLLESSPLLEVLILKFEAFSGFVTPKSPPAQMLSHLQRVHLHISKPICFGSNSEDVLNFFKFILTSAHVLEQLVFKYTSQLSRRGQK